MSNPTIIENPGAGNDLGQIVRGVVSKVITSADLTASAAAENIAIDGFPAKAYKVRAWVELRTPFTGGDASAVTVQIGDAGDPDELMVATSVFTGSGVLAGNGTAVGTYEAAYEPVARFTATSDTVDDLVAGMLVANIEYALPRIP